VLINIGALAIMRYLVPVNTPPVFHGTLEQTWPWLAFIAVQLVFAVVVIMQVSRAMTRSWFGKSARPVLTGGLTTGSLIAAPTAEAARKIELRPGL